MPCILKLSERNATMPKISKINYNLLIATRLSSVINKFVKANQPDSFHFRLLCTDKLGAFLSETL